jgi:N6-adenosine-specific RNA methylase IME4
MSEHGLVSQSASELTAWSGVELSATGLTFTQDVSYDEWSAIGERLQFIGKAVQFWIGDWVRYGEHRFGEKYTQAVELTGYEQGAIQNMVWVAENVDSSLRSEELSFSHHKEVASLKPAAQEALLQLAEDKELTVRELRDEVRAFKRVEQMQTAKPLPDGKYRVIYADPPWLYGDKLIDGYGAAEHHYPSMSIDELCAMPIAELAADEAVLFLWVTSPMLEESFTVIRAWNFAYKASFVWDKVKHNYGHYNSVRHELLLVCTRGSYLPETSQLFDSVISVERSGRHSEKPGEVRKIIETLYPTGPRVELFARSEHDGWDAHGNDIATE